MIEIFCNLQENSKNTDARTQEKNQREKKNENEQKMRRNVVDLPFEACSSKDHRLCGE